MTSAQRKGGRSAIKIYQAVTYLGWSVHIPPNRPLLEVRQVGHTRVLPGFDKFFSWSEEWRSESLKVRSDLLNGFLS